MLMTQNMSEKMQQKQHHFRFQCSFCPRKMKTEIQFKKHEATHGIVSDVNLDKSVKQVAVEEDSKGKVDEEDEMIEVDKEELENLEKQAKIYDELVIKCHELEKEIQDLQIKNNITEEEIRNIDEQVEKEIKHEKAIIDKVENESLTCDKYPQNMNPDSLKKEEDDTNNIIADFQNKTESNEDKSKVDDATDGIEWLKDFPSVPPGWTLGLNKSDRSKRLFKSPEGFVFETRVKALEFMVNGDYSEEALNDMRRNLKDEGWYYDKSCPGRVGYGVGKNLKIVFHIYIAYYICEDHILITLEYNTFSPIID